MTPVKSAAQARHSRLGVVAYRCDLCGSWHCGTPQTVRMGRQAKRRPRQRVHVDDIDEGGC